MLQRSDAAMITVLLAVAPVLLAVAPAAREDSPYIVRSNAYDKSARQEIDPTQYGRDILRLHSKVSDRRLAELGELHRERFQSARPFPHLVVDGLFPDGYLRRVADEFPEVTVKQAHDNDCRRPGENLKCSIADDGTRVMATPYARGLYSLLISPGFTQFLEALTGIDGLVADSAFVGSGFDQTLPGGSLAIHTDFAFNRRLNLIRRVNVFLYLNPDWEEEYGGHLELWSATAQSVGTYEPKPHRMEGKVLPIFNRMFIFQARWGGRDSRDTLVLSVTGQPAEHAGK